MPTPEPHPALARWPEGYVIRTARLTVRPVEPDRATEVNDAIRESAAELRRWMPWCQEVPDPEATLEFARASADSFRARQNATLWAFDRDDAFVAATGYHPGHPRVPALAIGYWCRTSRVGQGYVTEIVRALAAVAFEHLRVGRLEITCDARNTRSANVARRCQFVREGLLRGDNVRVDGFPRETEYFSLVPGDPGIPSMDDVRFGPA